MRLLSLVAGLALVGQAQAQSVPNWFKAFNATTNPTGLGCTGCHSPDVTTGPHTAGDMNWDLTSLRGNAATISALQTYFAARVTASASTEMANFQTAATSNSALWTELQRFIFDLFDGYVALSGTPNTPISPVSPATVSFGSVAPGNTSSVTFNIKTARATWNAPAYTQQNGMRINVASIGLTTGTGSGSFTVGTPTCTELLPTYGNTCSVTVTFNAGTLAGTVAGTKSSFLNITFTDPYSNVAVNSRSIPLSGTTVQASVSRSPTSLSLSSPVNQALTSSDITITNASATVPLELENMAGGAAITGTHAGDFSITTGSTNSCTLSGQSLAGNASCRVRVIFTPQAGGGRSASFTIPSNGTNAPVVTLNGTGETRTLAASLSISGTPTISTFTYTPAVSQGSSTTNTFYVLNTGNSAINAPTVTIGATGAGTDAVLEFTQPTGLAGGTCSALGAGGLASGTTCSIIIQYKPDISPALGSAATTRTATARLTFASSNATNTAAVDLSATAKGLDNPTSTPTGGTAVSPTALSLGSALVGTTGATTQTITLTNPRSTTVTYTLSKTGTNASDFVATESCPTGVIPANSASNCTITYRFTPPLSLTAGSRTARVSISLAPATGDPTPTNSPLVYDLSATATTAPSFAISSNALTLSSVVNIAASPVTLTVTNNGTAALSLSGLTLGGANPGDYARSGTCTTSTSLAGTTAAPRSSCTVIITFTPGAVGARNATLTIAHNDTTVDAGSTVVTLNGTGNPSLTPVLDVGGTSQLSFGSVLQGANSQLSFTVRNANTNGGATAMQLTGLAITGAAASDFTRGGTCTPTTSLAASASCTVTVTFAPQAAGARGATLDVTTSNATNASITLSGTGVALADATLSGVPLAAFPSTLVTTTSSTSGTVTINNPRGNSITYGTSFSGANGSDFQVGSESCATRVVPAGGSCTVQVRFTPANGAAGTRSGSLVVAFVGFGTDPNPATLSTPLSGTAELPAPVFSITSSTLNFLTVVLTPTTGSAVITNTGTANLSLSNLAFSGPHASDFRLAPSNTCTSTTTLTPSSSCTLVVLHDPAAAGASSDTLTITSNAASSPHTVTLSSTATPTPRPNIALSSLSVTFGGFILGTPSTQTVSVQNTGNAVLNFSSLAISGAAASDFARSGTCAVGTPLNPSAQCVLNITFNPTVAGARNASLTVASDASNGTATVSLSGTGVPVPAPVVTLTSTAGLPLEFGSQTVGGLYPSRRVTLTNSGNADLVISSLTVTGTGYSDASATACPTTLTAGSSCAIDVLFSPNAASATVYNGAVRVVSNATSSPDQAVLHGTGTAAAVPSIVWLPLVSQLSFGQVQAGAVSAVQSATLKNAGPGGVRLTLLNAVGPDAQAFSVTAGSCAIGDVLFEGDTCRVDIRFAPGNAGTKSANVQVASSGSFPSDLVLSGIGMGGPNPGLALSQRTMSIGTVRVGSQSAPAELTLSANGSGVVRITALTASSGFTVQTKTCPALPFTLQAGAECTVTVSFTPQTVGATSGTLTISSDATNGTTQSVALTGNGEEQAKVSSGGCSISQADSPVDPSLWMLVLMALAGLGLRGHQRRQAARRAP